MIKTIFKQIFFTYNFVEQRRSYCIYAGSNIVGVKFCKILVFQVYNYFMDPYTRIGGRDGNMAELRLRGFSINRNVKTPMLALQ